MGLLRDLNVVAAADGSLQLGVLDLFLNELVEEARPENLCSDLPHAWSQ